MNMRLTHNVERGDTRIIVSNTSADAEHTWREAEAKAREALEIILSSAYQKEEFTLYEYNRLMGDLFGIGLTLRNMSRSALTLKTVMALGEPYSRMLNFETPGETIYEFLIDLYTREGELRCRITLEIRGIYEE